MIWKPNHGCDDEEEEGKRTGEEDISRLLAAGGWGRISECDRRYCIIAIGLFGGCWGQR